MQTAANSWSLLRLKQQSAAPKGPWLHGPEFWLLRDAPELPRDFGGLVELAPGIGEFCHGPTRRYREYAAAASGRWQFYGRGDRLRRLVSRELLPAVLRSTDKVCPARLIGVPPSGGGVTTTVSWLHMKAQSPETLILISLCPFIFGTGAPAAGGVARRISPCRMAAGQ